MVCCVSDDEGAGGCPAYGEEVLSSLNDWREDVHIAVAFEYLFSSLVNHDLRTY